MSQCIVLSVAALQVRLCLKMSLLLGDKTQGHFSDLFSLCSECLSQPSHLSTERRITGLLRFEGISLSHLAQPPVQEWLMRAGCPCPCPGDFLISPGMETPQHLWATWANVWSPSWGHCSKMCKEASAYLHHTPKNAYWILGNWTVF